ncbi:melanoma cell adhesion molecule b isoform X7 [Gadus morhua]|uniref:melanoma cell adhesion molecule b isoform X7 n=1 Tax=Gadus morhua TaxID=8049 RepID=UPI0011B72114|nr:cell surface glycoprotein MUC18 isoform X7 [Gadus morhua]
MALRTMTALLVGLFFLLHTWGVKAQVKVAMEDRVEVTLGTAAEIPCLYTTDDGFGGLIIEWFYLDPAGKQHRIYFQDPTMRIEETNSQFTGRIKVDVTPSQGSGQVLLRVLETRLGDEVDFICLVKSLTDGNDQGKTQLRVFEKPDHPIIESVDEEIWYNNEEPVKIGSCEAKNGYPRPNITWYKDNTPLSNVPNEVSVESRVATGSSGLFSVESELSLKVVKEDQGSEFYCEVNYQVIGGFGMLESEKKKIRVRYPSDEVNLWVKSPKRDIKEGDTVEFECLGNGNPQPLVTFRRERVELNAINNVLELRNVSRLDSGRYECVTTHIETFEEVVGNTTLFVNYLEPADVSPEETLTLSQGADLNQSCNALSSLKTHTVWMKNGVKVATGNILSLRDVVYDMAGTYECMVTVPQLVGMETSAVFQLIVEGSPEISEPQSTSLEQAVESTVVLTCRARGNPRPTITWRSAGSLVDSQSNVTEDGVLSWVNVKVSSDLNVSCHASNTNGNVETLYSIKAIVPTTASPTTTLATVVPINDRPASTVGTAGSSGVIIAVLIICLLLLAILGSVLYFLYKKGKICGRSGKQDLTKEKTSRDNIVVEMKSDNTEEAVLLAVNGDKKSGDQ